MSIATIRLMTSRVVTQSRVVLTRSITSTTNKTCLLKPRFVSNLSSTSSSLLNRTTPCTLNLVSSLSNQANSSEIKQKINQLVNNKSVVLFIKGTADQPRCGFSKAVVDIMKLHGVPFESHNVLEDESLRSGIKEYSNWPTIPQIFFKGEFIGGCDILLEMHRSGELVDELKKIGIKSKLEDEEGGDEDKDEETTTKNKKK